MFVTEGKTYTLSLNMNTNSRNGENEKFKLINKKVCTYKNIDGILNRNNFYISKLNLKCKNCFYSIFKYKT